jgi:uncharacterized protein YbjT (DUF2867 family)
MGERFLVTGATGNVGREVVRALLARGREVRAAVSRPEEAVEGAEAVKFDLRDKGTWGAALEGCAGVFLMRPPPISDVEQTLNPFADAARGLPVVFLSVAGAGENKIIPHYKVERHLERRSGAYTLLRPGFFAQNLQDAYRRDIAEDDRIYVPAGAGRAAFVDVRDVAALAAEALCEPQVHAGQAYTLTGPEAVSFEQAAAWLSEALGRPIRYERASVAGYVHHLRTRRGMAMAQIAVQTILHVGLRFGQAETVDPTLERLLGRPTGTLKRYIKDHVAVWARG